MYPPVIQFETRRHEIEERLRLLEARHHHLEALRARHGRRLTFRFRRPAPVATMPSPNC